MVAASPAQRLHKLLATRTKEVHILHAKLQEARSQRCVVRAPPSWTAAVAQARLPGSCLTQVAGMSCRDALGVTKVALTAQLKSLVCQSAASQSTATDSQQLHEVARLMAGGLDQLCDLAGISLNSTAGESSGLLHGSRRCMLRDVTCEEGPQAGRAADATPSPPRAGAADQITQLATWVEARAGAAHADSFSFGTADGAPRWVRQWRRPVGCCAPPRLAGGLSGCGS